MSTAALEGIFCGKSSSNELREYLHPGRGQFRQVPMKEVLLFVEPNRELREPFAIRLRALGYRVTEEDSLDSGLSTSSLPAGVAAIILGSSVPNRLNFIKASTRFRRETPILVVANLSVDEMISDELAADRSEDRTNDDQSDIEHSLPLDELQLLLKTGGIGPLFPMSGDHRIKQLISEAIRNSVPPTDQAVNLPWVIEGVAGRLEKIAEATRNGDSLSPVEEIAKRAVLLALDSGERGDAAITADEASLVLRGKPKEL